MTLKPIYFDELPIGRQTETEWHEMTREAIVAFAGEYDPQPFHVSDEGGRTSGFGRLVASGLHTFAVFNKLRMAIDGGIVVTAGLGFDKLRFLVPVEPGDRLRVRGEVVESRVSQSKPDRGVVGWEFLVVNQRDEAVLSLEFRLMVAMDPKALERS